MRSHLTALGSGGQQTGTPKSATDSILRSRIHRVPSSLCDAIRESV